jgi:citrate synthase
VRLEYNLARSTLMLSCRTGSDPLLDTAMALHDAAMKDDYFTKRNLAPNVDFW